MVMFIVPGGRDRSRPVKQMPGDDPYGLEESMLQLQNVQHDFEVEVGHVGVTVRKGDKWHNLFQQDLTGEIALWECPRPHHGKCDASMGCEHRGVGRMIGAWYGPLSQLPAELLFIEHEVASRTMEGLKRSLERAYGEVKDGELVTALIYERISQIFDGS